MPETAGFGLPRRRAEGGMQKVGRHGMGETDFPTQPGRSPQAGRRPHLRSASCWRGVSHVPWMVTTHTTRGSCVHFSSWSVRIE